MCSRLSTCTLAAVYDPIAMLSLVRTDIRMGIHLEGRKIFLGLLGRGVHCIASGRPASWANLVRILLHILYCLQNTERLLHIAPKGQVVDGCVLDHTLQYI